MICIALGRYSHLAHLVAGLSIKPAQTFVLGFALFIVLGALLLHLPISLQPFQQISFLDAFFTATSAVCVTGLTVNDVHLVFSRFGQTVILLLIQFGGLGIMSFSILLARLFKSRISQQASLEYQESFQAFNLKETFDAIGFLFKLTIVVEIIGALLIFIFTFNRFSTFQDAMFNATFHSISAFCNAGFSLFSDSLMSFYSNAPFILTISALIILGGLGFPIIYNAMQVWLNPHSKYRIKLQTKIAVRVTLILLIFGTVAFWITESSHALATYPMSDQWLISFFHSVSARTAGFVSTNIQDFQPISLTIMMILMIIGASPGSTGGGIKTTTFGLMMIAFWNTIKGAHAIVVSHRTIVTQSIFKAFSVCLFAIMIIGGFFGVLLQTETAPVMTILFETISAFGTVGLSLGLTPELSDWGKFLTMVLMFVGRIGPLTLFFALADTQKEPSYRYPDERILIT